MLKERDSTNLFTVGRDTATACTYSLVTKKTTEHCHTHTKVTKNEGDTTLYVTIYVHHKRSTKDNGRSKVIRIVGHVTQLCDMMESSLEAWSFGCVCRLGTLGLA